MKKGFLNILIKISGPKQKLGFQLKFNNKI